MKLQLKLKLNLKQKLKPKLKPKPKPNLKTKLLKQCVLGFLGAVSTLLSISCASTSDTKSSPPAKLTQQEETQAAEMRAEIEIGRNMTGRLISAYGKNENKALTDYVALIGTYLGDTGDFPGYRFAFEITENNSISAYSSPGGYILISKGAIAMAENEAELAGILAHELTHVVKRHVLKVIRKRDAQAQKQIDDPQIKMREREHTSQESQAGAALARYLSGPNGAALSIVAAARSGLAALVQDGLDHDMEFEADSYGLQATMRAGYNGAAYIAYLERLNKKSGTAATASLDKTHPDLKIRIEKLKAQYKALSTDLAGSALGKERFMQMTSSLQKSSLQKSSLQKSGFYSKLYNQTTAQK